MRFMHFLRAIGIALALTLSCAAGSVLAQAWPQKPVRWVISFAPGGVHDTLSRLLQPKLQESLGQPLLIENRGGAGGNLAAETVARSAPEIGRAHV